METKIHRSNVLGIEWGLLIGILIIIDIVQIVLDLLFAVGVAVNRYIDIVVGGALLLYLALRGEFRNPQSRDRLILAFIATIIIEEIPVADIAPAWSIDGWFCWRQAVAVNKLADQQEKQQKEEAQQNQLQNQQEKIFKLQAIRQAQQEELYEEAA